MWGRHKIIFVDGCYSSLCSGAYFLRLLLQSCAPENQSVFFFAAKQNYCYWKILLFELALLTLSQTSIPILYLLVVHKSSVEGFNFGGFWMRWWKHFSLEGFVLWTNALTVLMDSSHKILIWMKLWFATGVSQCFVHYSSGGALTSLFPHLNAYFSPKQFVLSVFLHFFWKKSVLEFEIFHFN